jgi:hypothetical protein
VSDLIASCNDREPEKVGSIAEGQWNDFRLFARTLEIAQQRMFLAFLESFFWKCP